MEHVGEGLHTAGWIANQVAWIRTAMWFLLPMRTSRLLYRRLAGRRILESATLCWCTGDRAVQSGEPDAGKPLTITAVLIALDAVHDDLPLLEKLGTEMAKKLYMRHKVT